MTDKAQTALDFCRTKALAYIGTSDEDASRFADRLHGWTRGNPFFVEETLKALVERGAIVQRGEHYSTVRSAISFEQVPGQAEPYLRTAVPGSKVMRWQTPRTPDPT